MHDVAGPPENLPETDDQALFRVHRRQVVGALADGIAHDSNNTLAAILAGLELALSDPALPPHLNGRLAKLVVLARRAAGFNAKIQAFSRQSKTRAGPVSLPKLLDDALLLLRPSLRARQVELSCAAPPADLWPAQADQEQVMQVFLNLCLHTRDALPEGSQLALRLANERVAGAPVPPRRTGDFVTLALSEVGGDGAARLWTPLRESQAAGPGLDFDADFGAEVSKQILAQHGGWIETGADADRGCYVKMFLPRAVVPAAGLASDQPPPGRATVPDDPSTGHGAILVVDDEEQIRWLVRAILAYRGYTVLEASGVAEAAHLGASAAGKIGVVLLKANLPASSEAEFGERIRQSNPETAVVLMADQDWVAPPDLTGSSKASVLRKPLSSETVLRAVRRALDARKAGQEP